MAITGPLSYIATSDEFIAHWRSADFSLRATGPITVLNGVPLAGLMDLRRQLEAGRAEVRALRHSRETARAEADSGKTALLERLARLRRERCPAAPRTSLETALARAFSASEGYAGILSVMREWEDFENKNEIKSE